MAIMVLAIAIGTNSGIYTLVDDLSVSEPAGTNVENVLLIGGMPRDPQYTNFFKIDSVFTDTIRQNREVFTDISQVLETRLTLTGISDPMRLKALRVGPNFAQIIGLQADVGRAFEPRDYDAGALPGAMITHDTWKRGWNSAPDAIGSIVMLNGKQHRIVGVLPDSFAFERIKLSIITATRFTSEEFSNWTPYCLFLGAVKPGTSEVQAQTEITALEAQLHGMERLPDYWEYVRLGVKELNHFENEYLETQMNILLGVGIVILAIAAFNVTNLTLVRLNRRGGEYATRVALGASRWDLVRISVFENGILIVAGFILGIGFGHALIQIAIKGFEGAEWGLLSQLGSNVSLNGRVLAYTGAACLVALVFISLATLIFSRTKSISVFIKQDTRSSTGSVVFNRVTNALLFLKIALTCCLLILGGFFFHSLSKLNQFDFGYRLENIHHGYINFPYYRFEKEQKPVALSAMRESILEAIRSVPGVETVTISYLQCPHWGRDKRIKLKDTPADLKDQDLPLATRGDVDPNFFELIGLKTIQGETFGPEHNALDSEPVVVINEAFVKKHFADKNPVGEFIETRNNDGQYSSYRIIGVVSDIRRWWREGGEPQPGMYFPIAQGNEGYYWGWIYFKARYWSPEVERQVNEAIRRVESEVVQNGFSSLRGFVAESQNSFRFIVFIQTLVSVIGLLLSCVGIYSAVSNAVAQRRREMGIRLALGASPRRIRNRIMMRSAALVIPALLLGVLGAYLVLVVFDLLENQLPLVEPTRWSVYALCALLMFGVGMIATLQPALQAARSDPNQTLGDGK